MSLAAFILAVLLYAAVRTPDMAEWLARTQKEIQDEVSRKK